MFRYRKAAPPVVGLCPTIGGAVQFLSVFTCFCIAISLLKYALINLLFTLLFALSSFSTEHVTLSDGFFHL